MADNRSIPTHGVLPHLACADVEKSIAWLTSVFDFKEHYRYGDPAAGAQMYAANALIMLTRTKPGVDTPLNAGVGTQSLTLFLDDVRPQFERVKAAGAKIVEDLNETIYGELQFGVEDLDGHRWLFAQHVRDLAPTDWGAVVAAAQP